MATPTPALPKDFLVRYDCSSCSGKAGQNDKVGGELVVHTERSTASAGCRDRRRASAAKSFNSEGSASASGSLSAQNAAVAGAREDVFGGAFSAATAVSPDDRENLKPDAACVHAAGSSVHERGQGCATHTIVTTAESKLPAAEPSILPSEGYFIAYGHCLLAGAGTGASDEAAEEATEGARSVAGEFGGASGRARVSKKKRARGYGDALEIFQEGLRRFPASAALLYGASLAMQARA